MATESKILIDIIASQYSQYNVNINSDFYISTYLEIEHKQGISYYQLSTQCGFYCDFIRRMNASDLYNESTYYERNNSEVYDSSQAVKSEHLEKYEQLTEMYEKMCDILKGFTLAPRKPIVIYADNSFVTTVLETNYLPIIQNKLNKIYVNNLCLYEDTGSFTDISEVIKITKKTEIVEPSIMKKSGRAAEGVRGNSGEHSS